ncbi:IS1634 family transposase [Geochorda subterranea]|uniref:IS1634 family transposase n=1 Tax=Geochorda subterranea TaxID=3109564 RepID=A0ABZ1BSY0_9FIRM|nr:IS1634 family transposase [Limnochorda sp. LNt]WRP15720.1 IS1634 family transposase [Limnochorda sp. LNt]
MHIETIRRRQGDKVYTYHLLRQTYREGGKVKHRTLANLSHLPEAVLELVRRALRGEPVAPVPQTVKIRQSRQHGAVAAVVGMIRQLGLDQVLYSRSADWVRVALAVVVMRILRPSSKLGGTLWWTTTTLPQLLRLPHNGEDVNDVYRAMDELLARQAAIEAKLARRHLTANALVLYDLTSVYLEGKTCPLARFGYNRDKKRGKKQFCVGLLTNDEGCPVAVEVFPGDVGDPETLRAQIARVRARFGIEYVVFVGDRGMIVKARLSDLEAVGFGWITALRAPEIQKLRDEGFFQPGLFDRRDLAEIADPERPGSGWWSATIRWWPRSAGKARGAAFGHGAGAGQNRSPGAPSPPQAPDGRRNRGGRGQGPGPLEGGQALPAGDPRRPLRLPAQGGLHRPGGGAGRVLRAAHQRAGRPDGAGQGAGHVQIVAGPGAKLPHDEKRPGPASGLPPAGGPGAGPRLFVHAGVVCALAHGAGA